MTTTIQTSLVHVKKIIHIADVHVRLYKRHDEYRNVFKNLYDLLDARDLSETAIVVVGDIVHAKTDMSPEMVSLASEFLKTLADKTDTIVISNHALNGLMGLAGVNGGTKSKKAAGRPNAKQPAANNVNGFESNPQSRATAKTKYTISSFLFTSKTLENNNLPPSNTDK